MDTDSYESFFGFKFLDLTARVRVIQEAQDAAGIADPKVLDARCLKWKGTVENTPRVRALKVAQTLGLCGDKRRVELSIASTDRAWTILSD
jgi:hypothetical protein